MYVYSSSRIENILLFSTVFPWTCLPVAVRFQDRISSAVGI